MANSNNNQISSIANLLLSIFTPGHLSQRVLVSICFGISLVGVSHIVLISMLSNLNLHVSYSVAKIAFWIAANGFLVVSHLIRKNFYGKLFANNNPMNSESVVEVSIKRAA